MYYSQIHRLKFRNSLYVMVSFVVIFIWFIIFKFCWLFFSLRYLFILSYLFMLSYLFIKFKKFINTHSWHLSLQVFSFISFLFLFFTLFRFFLLKLVKLTFHSHKFFIWTMLYNSFIFEKVNHITVLYSRKSMSNLYYSKTILLLLYNLVNFFLNSFLSYNV